MHFFYAVSGNIAKSGELHELCRWSQNRIAMGKAKIVKILKARSGEHNARIVFEITAEGIARTPHGRVINLVALKRAVHDDL
jgi:hypothetical protein